MTSLYLNPYSFFFSLKNLDVDDVKMQEKVQVQVDVIVQDNERKIPKWIMVTYFSCSVKSYLLIRKTLIL